MSGNVNILEKVLKTKLSTHEAVLVDLLCEATGHSVLVVSNATGWKYHLHEAHGGACMTLAPPVLNGGGWNKLAALAEAAGYVLNVEPAGRELEIGIKPKAVRG